MSWEVEAAHIVPHNEKGRDDVLNGLSLCHLHHWAFDSGWLTLQEDFRITVSSRVHSLPTNFGMMGNYDFIRVFIDSNSKLLFPIRKEIYPHQSALTWHRENKFCY